MEEIREAALAYYEAGTQEQRQLARAFFEALDVDGDGKVRLHEFINFLRDRGYFLLNNPNFFKELDRDGNGHLDFDEVLTFYYILKSRRPSCGGCGSFLKGLFFSCVKCHEISNNTFDICSACYRSKSFIHQHAAFLDNYALLAQTRLALLECKEESAAAMGQPDKSQLTYSGPGSTSLQPRRTKTEKVTQALNALETAISAGLIIVQGASLCAIL